MQSVAWLLLLLCLAALAGVCGGNHRLLSSRKRLDRERRPVLESKFRQTHPPSAFYSTHPCEGCDHFLITDDGVVEVSQSEMLADEHFPSADALIFTELGVTLQQRVRQSPAAADPILSCQCQFIPVSVNSALPTAINSNKPVNTSKPRSSPSKPNNTTPTSSPTTAVASTPAPAPSKPTPIRTSTATSAPTGVSPTMPKFSIVRASSSDSDHDDESVGAQPMKQTLMQYDPDFFGQRTTQEQYNSEEEQLDKQFGLESFLQYNNAGRKRSRTS